MWYLGSLGRTRTADRVSKVLLPTAKKGKNLKARCRAAGPVFLAIIHKKPCISSVAKQHHCNTVLIKPCSCSSPQQHSFVDSVIENF